MEWKTIKEHGYPEEDKPVLAAYEGGTTVLAIRTYIADEEHGGYVWAVFQSGYDVFDLDNYEWDDDYRFVQWAYISPPKE